MDGLDGLQGLTTSPNRPKLPQRGIRHLAIVAPKDELFFNPATLTVMIVDDHDPIRKGIKRIAQQLGFGEILECFDGDEALRYLAKKPVDVLVLDLYMRTVSGFKVLEHIRNRDLGSDIPVIVVTGEASKEEIVKVADMGAEDYVLKPFQSADLEKKIIRTLNQFYSPPPLLKALRKAERNLIASELQTAMSHYEEALKIDPSSARAMHGKSLTLDRLGRTDEAIQLLQECLKANHSFHRSYGAIANIYLRLDRVQDGIEALKNELQINPKQPTRQIQLAKLLLKEGDALGAIDHYREALKEDPKRLAALMGMGQAHAMTDNLDKALQYFKRARRHHPNNAKSLEAAVRCAMSANEPKKAEIFLKDDKAANPERTDAYTLLAMFFLNQGRDDEALATCDELLKRQPENSQALRMKAVVYMKKPDFNSAATILTQVTKVAPSAEVYTSLGEACIGLGKHSEALDALHRALAMNPDNPNALLLLAEIHRKSQQWIKAFYLYRKAARAGINREKCQADQSNCAEQIQKRRRVRAAS